MTERLNGAPPRLDSYASRLRHDGSEWPPGTTTHSEEPTAPRFPRLQPPAFLVGFAPDWLCCTGWSRCPELRRGRSATCGVPRGKGRKMALNGPRVRGLKRREARAVKVMSPASPSADGTLHPLRIVGKRGKPGARCRVSGSRRKRAANSRQLTAMETEIRLAQRESVSQVGYYI